MTSRSQYHDVTNVANYYNLVVRINRNARSLTLRIRIENQRWRKQILRDVWDVYCPNICPPQTHGQWHPWYVYFSGFVNLFLITFFSTYSKIHLFCLEKTHSADSHFPARKWKSEWSRGIYLLEERNSCWYAWTLFVRLNPIYFYCFNNSRLKHVDTSRMRLIKCPIN